MITTITERETELEARIETQGIVLRNVTETLLLVTKERDALLAALKERDAESKIDDLAFRGAIATVREREVIISAQRKVLEQALEALKTCRVSIKEDDEGLFCKTYYHDKSKADKAITAIQGVLK